jgi:hypothetical protein
MKHLKNHITFWGIALMLLFYKAASAQPDNNIINALNITLEGNVGIGLGKTEAIIDDKWTHIPSFALGGTVSLHYLFKEQFSIQAGGGISINNYPFSTDSFEYNLSYWLFHLQGGFQYLTELDDERDLYFQLVGGAQIGDNTSSFTQEGNLTVSFQQTAKAVPYIKPEIGLKMFRDYDAASELSILFRYGFDDVLWGDLRSDTSLTEYRSHGNYIAICYRHFIPIHIDRTPRVTPNEKLKEEFDARPTETVKTIDVENGVLKMYVYDSGAKVDGDIISITVNGVYVLEKYKLNKGLKLVTIHLEEGENEIVVHAHNVGKIPPNTAALTIQDGDKRKHLVINSNLETSSKLKLNYTK